ncbi:hypothetical protein [Pleurocapsa sp. CCALA 161]|uniref:hypothetical protein n=1 Tax=Pleurocapsa sp. CCALA 161 TaxID=2107688 RepID=UPI0018ED4094|nr:hypothetical protein [Pleurocapsa sp. CCALA 161]
MATVEGKSVKGLLELVYLKKKSSNYADVYLLKYQIQLFWLFPYSQAIARSNNNY